MEKTTIGLIKLIMVSVFFAWRLGGCWSITFSTRFDIGELGLNEKGSVLL